MRTRDEELARTARVIETVCMWALFGMVSAVAIAAGTCFWVGWIVVHWLFF